MRKLSYWIKERDNPQLGIYYVACGQMTVKFAKACERPLYGFNYMRKYPTRESYEQALAALRTAGEKVQ